MQAARCARTLAAATNLHTSLVPTCPRPTCSALIWMPGLSFCAASAAIVLLELRGRGKRHTVRLVPCAARAPGVPACTAQRAATRNPHPSRDPRQQPAHPPMCQLRKRNWRLRLDFSMTSSSVTVTTPPSPGRCKQAGEGEALPADVRSPRAQHPSHAAPALRGACCAQRPAHSPTPARAARAPAAMPIIAKFLRNSHPSAPAPTSNTLRPARRCCRVRPNTATWPSYLTAGGGGRTHTGAAWACGGRWGRGQQPRLGLPAC